jgi:hypothetical protein
VNRSIGALACIGFACWFVGCGGGGDSSLLSQTGVRECLAKAGIRADPSRAPGSGWTGYAPIYAADFTAYASDGTAVDVVVQGSARRAGETATHVRSALRSLGTPNAAARVVSAQNVVVIFSRPPSGTDRGAARGCLGS